MATIEFKNAVGRVYFDGGLTDEGKLIRKSKTYRNIAENAAADKSFVFAPKKMLHERMQQKY